MNISNMKILSTILALLFAGTINAQVVIFMPATGTPGGATYQVERIYNINMTNQFISETSITSWQGMQANGSGNVTAGYSKTAIADEDGISTGSIGFTAVTGFTGSSGSGPENPAGNNTSVFCNDFIINHGWISSASSVTIKLTNLQAGKYYQVGFLSNSVNWVGTSVKFSWGAVETAVFATGNNYGDCTPGGDYEDAAVKWIDNITGDVNGEASIVITRTAGSETWLNAMVVFETNVPKS